MTDETILQKIRAMLNRTTANGCTEAEAMTAAAMVAKLMDRYNLSDADVLAGLGSAFLCGDLGLSSAPRPDHARYLASWLKVLKGDNRAIFAAASAAAKATEWLGEQ